MATSNRKATAARLKRLRRWRQVQGAAAVALGLLAPVLAFATYLVMGPLDRGSTDPLLRIVVLADLIYVLVVAVLVLHRVARMFAARRAKSAGSRLHLRLTGIFGALALIPTVLVAIFAVLTVNVLLEGWFSERVQRVVGNSLAAATAYEEEQKTDLLLDARILAARLNLRRQATSFLDEGTLREELTSGQAAVQRGLKEAYVIDGSKDLRARGRDSYLFDFESPSDADMEAARTDEDVVIRDWDNNEFRVLIRLDAFVDRYLYVSRSVDGEILNLLDETRETIELYNQIEQTRGRTLFEFGLIYLGFALILILAAIWFGLWFAERLAQPVGRLTSAAQRVGAGDLNVQVIEEGGDDEIGELSRYFNQMTRALRAQRDTLMVSNEQTETQRRLFDSVLSSITSGVVGLNATGCVEFVNPAATRLLSLPDQGDDRVNLAVAVPEFGPLFEQIKNGQRDIAQQEVHVTRNGIHESLLVRMAKRRNTDDALEGFVVSFDDVTDLVSAQRMAAWGDVARRIAHEIKNPLTPIQLSAERIKRKFAPKLGEDSDTLEQMTDVIIRQTNDLRRIVDEFSKFARMPAPERTRQDILAIVRDAVLLQDAGRPDITFDAHVPAGRAWASIDSTMVSQALTNLIKNAGEATDTRIEKRGDDFVPTVIVRAKAENDGLCIEITDNGIGLPENRAKLFEPYVTTRDKGTGLGLPIVKKIIEEHDGTLELMDAPVDTAGDHAGAMAKIWLPGPMDWDPADDKVKETEAVV